MLYAVLTFLSEHEEDSYVECITNDYEVVKALTTKSDEHDTSGVELKSNTLEDAINELLEEWSMYQVYMSSIAELGIVHYEDLVRVLIVEPDKSFKDIKPHTFVPARRLSKIVTLKQEDTRIEVILPIFVSNLENRVTQLANAIKQYTFINDVKDLYFIIKELTTSEFKELELNEIIT